jgi:hypothetical protein
MTFYPDNSSDWLTFALGVALAAVGFGFAFALSKGRIGGTDANRRNLGAMLSFFAGLLGLGLLVFTGWFLYRMQPVTIDANTLTTGFGTYPITAVKDAQIVTDTRKSFVNPNVQMGSDRLLVIELGNEESIALPGKKYDLEAILRALRQAKGIKTKE